MKEQKHSQEYMEKYNLKTEYREIEKFLWFPKIINGNFRWLKKSKWIEERFQYHEPNIISFILNPTNAGNYDTRWSDWKPIQWFN